MLVNDFNLNRLILFQQLFIYMNNNLFWMPNCYPPIQNCHPPHYCPELATLTQHYRHLQQKHEQLRESYSNLQANYSNLLEKTTKKRKVNRRTDTELVRTHACPYQQCKKEYASDLALNLHLQQKHKAGNKKQREKLAKKVIKCELQGKQPPRESICLPPGYLEKNRVRLLLLASDCESEGQELKQQNSS